MQIDASDEDALRRAMHGSGLVINTALPRFNRLIQSAALGEHVNYLDPANDSADPFVDSDTWKAAGLTALCAMGEDPGLSNVFARYAADGMDRVESIKVRDGDTASSPDYPFIALFSPETFVEETLAPSRIWRDGQYEALPPFGEFETYEFPAPIGPLPGDSRAHAQVDTLPRSTRTRGRYRDLYLPLHPAPVQPLTL